MMMPSIFGESLFDDFFDFPFAAYSYPVSDLMKTDVKDIVAQLSRQKSKIFIMN